MSLNKQIIPAIIANNQEELEKRVYKVSDYVEIIQLDFMDGNFVPNNSIDFDFKLPKTRCKFEAHLMIKDPNIWIEKNYMKVETILVHVESIKNPFEIIKMVKEKAKYIGFVLNPETNINKIVRPMDKLYMLGDVVMYRRNFTLLDRINTKKRILIRGNHDIFKLKDYLPYFKDIRAYKVMPKHGIIFSHVPIHPCQLDHPCPNRQSRPGLSYRYRNNRSPSSRPWYRCRCRYHWQARTNGSR